MPTTVDNIERFLDLLLSEAEWFSRKKSQNHKKDDLLVQLARKTVGLEAGKVPSLLKNLGKEFRTVQEVLHNRFPNFLA